MRIDTHVTYGACQIFIFCIVDMPSSFGINILFGKSEVHDMNDMWGILGQPTNEAVFRFDVTVYQMFPVGEMASYKMFF